MAISSSTIFILENFHSRKLLQPTMATASLPASIGHSLTTESVGGNAFDANVVMVLSILLCALICSLGMNSIIRCALRCTSLIRSQNQQSVDPSVTLANTGIKKKALKTFPTVTYTNDLNLPGLDTECVICLSEFVTGECVRVLPKCNHGFHVRCIDKWLNSHSSCPTCRHSLIETCQKIVDYNTLSSTSQIIPLPPSPQSEGSIVVRIEPLPREGLISNRQI